MRKIVILLGLLVYFCFLATPISAAGVNGDAQISGMFDGSPIVIKTTDRLAGAIDSIVWKGKEFLVSSDHGRSIQYAWFLNNQGECNNPTEAGSADDGTGLISSSILKSINISGNKLITVTNPAYWLAPGKSSSSCGSTPGAVNTSKVSNYTLTKTVTIGYQNLANVIEFVADVNVPEQVTEMMIQPPIFCQKDYFSNFSIFNPSTKNVTNITDQMHQLNNKFSHLPTILSTSDGSYALGVYSPDIIGENQGSLSYSLLYYIGIPPNDPAVNCQGPLYYRGATSLDTYRYRTFAVIGTLDQVTTTINKLYQLLPSKLETPVVGYLGPMDCQKIQGWSGWLDNADQQINVSLYADGSINSGGSFLGQITTQNSWGPNLCKVLNGTGCDSCTYGVNLPRCLHGFDFPMPLRLKDGKSHQVYAYGTSPSGYMRQLDDAPQLITCPTIIPGDFDGNNKVDIFDYNLLVGNFGKTTCGNVADINGNCKVDIFDYNILVGNFGKNQ